MKIHPEPFSKQTYQPLWQKVIKKVMLNLKILKLLKSYKSEISEDFDEIIRRTSNLGRMKTQVKIPFGLLTPSSIMRNIWDIFIGVLLLYTAIVIPYSVSFLDVQPEDKISQIDFIIDICFIFDFLMNLNTAYYNEDNILVLSRLSIIKNYLKNGMLIDLLSSFPFSFLAVSSKGYSTLTRIFRLRALSKLFKISKLFKFFQKQENSILRYLQNIFGFSHNFFSALKFVSFLLIIIHLAACVWFLVAKFDDFGPNTWVVKTGHIDDPEYRLYIISFYWTLVTLATIGYGDIHPYSENERLFAIIWMLVALYFLAFSISTLSSMLTYIDKKKLMMQQKMFFIDEFSQQVKLSKRLKKELQKALIQRIDDFSYSYEDRINLVSDFPNELKLEIANTMQKGKLLRCELFFQEDENFLLEILPLMQSGNLNCSQVVYSYGENSTKIYFLVKGRVHFLLKNEKTVFQAFSERQYFGDIEVALGTHRLNTAITATPCRIVVLGSDLYTKIKNNYPGFYKKIKDAARVRLAIFKKKKIEMKTLLKLNRDNCISRKNLGKIKEIIRRKTLKVQEQGLDVNKELQKRTARENLMMTSENLSKIRVEIERVKKIMRLLDKNIE